MPKFRVMFRRNTSVELYLDVEADSEDLALKAAGKQTESDDDCLTEIPESYEYDCGPTGEVVAEEFLPDEEDED